MSTPKMPWHKRRDVPFLLFVAWAATTFMLTHWPALEVPPIITHTDWVAHVGTFGLWTVLCGAAGFFGPVLSGRNIGLTAIASLAYALVDEGLQALPLLRRQCSLDDYGCNAIGVLAGSIVLLAVARRFDARAGISPP